ncbi:MAG: YihY/virulence factor BrkB family protein [Flavobacteriaceae bacterium]|nr:YihY/virulence factor BrkB family protein [Flavobacteriaceae bacterium]MBT6170213.1 YihY/virulence factor BrkB family protein [Flavobacteriaceae bacterium]MBT6449013.1 YihY/virulence factor BrkB family protein [Flavobacteriaceae bacterium]MBT7624424.1 YihY/virulence factor BrkB family protein [Flavobacteriaceae bacterium]
MRLLKTNFIFSIINNISNFLKKIKLESLYGFSLYELFRLYFTGILKGAISTRAGSISFSFFMAFFPFVLFVLNLIPFFPIENFDKIFLDLLESLLPQESTVFFHDIFLDINTNKRSGLLSSTLFFSIILIGNGVNSVFEGFSDSYHVEFSRNFIKQYLYAIMVGFILVLVVLFATVISIFFDFLIAKNISIISYLFVYFKYIFLIIVALIAFSSLYFFGTIHGSNLKFISPGSIMTTFLLIITTYFFGLYIENFSNYNELYGSIGALIIMMLYIWINSISLLLGFELNVVIYKLKNN